MTDKFSFFQQPFVKTSVLLRHSYSLARGLLFFLAGISFLVLTACAGGSGSGSSGGGSSDDEGFKVELTFSPMADGFVIGNQSSFGDFVSLNITAESDGGIIMRYPPINIDQFINSIYTLDGLTEANWTFEIVGTLSDGSARGVTIDFTWEENKEDHNNGGIRTGINTDGDGRADSVDDNDDNDGRLDHEDNCPVDVNDDQSDTDSDQVGDACDTDDDNDGLDDVDEPEGCELNSDCDNDGLDDGDEVAGCVLLADCDSDTIGDEGDACPAGVADSASNDKDSDGCRDDIEDIDDDGDGLIEIGTDEELNSVRYALNGNGSRSAANAALDTSGCGGDDGITSCSGYELVANISLATYADDEGGKGWRPLGHDTDGSGGGCQGAAFDGTFEGNGWTISDLNINRSGKDCAGLFGRIAVDSEIRNLALRGETVIGNNFVGGLVAFGQGAQIVSSSVVIEEIRGSGSVGGLVGDGESVRIYSSSVVAAEVRGFGVLEEGISNRVGSRIVGGLVGWGQDARIHSSSVVAVVISADSFVGGLVGDGSLAQIFSSSVVVEEISGASFVGGLMGSSIMAQLFSSSAVVGGMSGTNSVGGLMGAFSGKIAYSYVVSGSDTPMLVGQGGGTEAASYWDSDTSSATSRNIGEPKSTSALRMPMDYTGIYADWADDTDIFGDGMSDEPLAVWCDRDHSGSIEEGENINDNRIWDFGGSDEYPAIRCTPLAPADWRNWWSLNSTNQPELNQMLLNQELNK